MHRTVTVAPTVGVLWGVVVGVRSIVQVCPSHSSVIWPRVTAFTSPVIWSPCPNAALQESHPAAITPVKVFSFMQTLNACRMLRCKLFAGLAADSPIFPRGLLAAVPVSRSHWSPSHKGSEEQGNRESANHGSSEIRLHRFLMGPNETQMSCGERERAWLQNKETKSRKDCYRAGSPSAPSIR